MFEYKVGGRAIGKPEHIDKRCDEADVFAKGKRTFGHGRPPGGHEFDGLTAVFARESESLKALELVVEHAGARKKALLDIIDSGRFHVGYFDDAGKLKFFSKDDLKALLEVPPGGGGGPKPTTKP